MRLDRCSGSDDTTYDFGIAAADVDWRPERLIASDGYGRGVAAEPRCHLGSLRREQAVGQQTAESK
jgi:hypothetical protein